MTSRPLHVAVLLGSVRPGRFGPVVGSWFADRVEGRDDLTVDLVDLAVPEQLTARLAAADAFVVVTPEYNHSYPGRLKEVIDAHFVEWQARPVGFVSYGGLSGGLRAVEHLRAVFAELQAVTIRETVSFHGGSQRFTAEGQPHDRADCDAAAYRLLDQLAWWGHALRDARAARPYAAA
ncbi:NADPH-dependent FMN reductase [Micromonospora yangpuensis]|uniref:NAD(P)H-dependent FMN reductase n=1 Tax=Micromonospora yangpuensis TaxID=683228 RepID=A0A1C6VG65_9ACTN|nr:NAD(P)H-dependent oxidoreductase [Micromonospora yangpuensis]GGM31193.1 FMN reductase [Micromonospora yangpuensis]SCL65177.1 NAD(P)H-dependent FMN reductase [Micromonospora yangpuensis]